MNEESLGSNIVTHDCYSDFIKKDLEFNSDDFTFTKPRGFSWS
jgi:hypothetical protein